MYIKIEIEENGKTGCEVNIEDKKSAIDILSTARKIQDVLISHFPRAVRKEIDRLAPPREKERKLKKEKFFFSHKKIAAESGGKEEEE